jgi:hypothetical protein
MKIPTKSGSRSCPIVGKVQLRRLKPTEDIQPTEGIGPTEGIERTDGFGPAEEMEGGD